VTGTTAVAFLLTVALSFLTPRLRNSRRETAVAAPISAKQTRTTAISTGETDLPVEHEDPDLRESVALSHRIADLMIAEEWFEIADLISDWEATLTATPGGFRYHEIAVKTCLSGLQGLLDDAPRNSLADLDDALTEVAHFVDTHRQSPDNHVLAVLAARAHMKVGEACAADDWPEGERKGAWRKMAQHFIAAGEIIKDFDALALMSPLLAEAHYLQALGSPKVEERLESLFEQWIDLDPSNPRIYATHIDALVAQDLISSEDVLREAEQAMLRTESSIGLGGYAVFFMPLLSEYDTARDHLDPELYAAALMDLASASATQAEINNSAAALLTEVESSDEATAAACRETLMVMIRQHLQVIYPRLWPISVEEIQELVAEAALVAPDILPERPISFVTSRPQSVAA
jgi:hypothetical protein